MVRAFHITVGRCAGCGRRVHGRHPLQTSDALGAAAVHLGPHAVTLLAVLNTPLGLPLGKISTRLREQFGLRVTPGGLVQALPRTARHAHLPQAALQATIRGSPIVAPDETGWKVGGHMHWLWAFTTPDTTVYAIQPGRGCVDATAILGADVTGGLVRDGWAPDRRCTAAVHQTCLGASAAPGAHTLHQDHPATRCAGHVQPLLHQALAVRARHAAGQISGHAWRRGGARASERVPSLASSTTRPARA